VLWWAALRAISLVTMPSLAQRQVALLAVTKRTNVDECRAMRLVEAGRASSGNAFVYWGLVAPLRDTLVVQEHPTEIPPNWRAQNDFGGPRGWQETTRPFRRRLFHAVSFVLGVIILATVAYREGWEAVLFVLIFLAIWELATYGVVS
jgi:hypothetical protein